jgi:hypothetical protein
MPLIGTTKRPSRLRTALPTEAIEDKRLCWGALGILAYLLARQPTLITQEQELIEGSPDPPDVTHRYIEELIESG